ncbi:winged helix-turn-helix domain-containing protein [Pseudobacillus badius]|uniref:winged helix-turn-helix domain-containing protein n=1 Tax=Bacillus badius TaxID=1455 RepID=UPI0007B07C4C|nr:transcriptional regulator [Bacillus badius]KZN99412.1 transcriptional regulator [Bacillus badius]OCS85106.1 transcriptional regulator [Bacillus badius]OVE46752.1 transcriptional regulator [Bacillus badius]TDV98363.1 winged helix DNA-binding protein [Bacillus badius]
MSNVNELDDLIHAKVRLGIMSLLMTYESCDFSLLKKSLGITDGNLGSHLKKLEEAEYIQVTKTFVAKKPKTIIQVTDLGVQAYKNYIKTIEAILKNNG